MYKFQTRINFFDADPAGILFYGKIFELCHAAYESFVDSFNLQENFFAHSSLAIPIIHSEADYSKPLHFGQTITVNIYVDKKGESSFSLRYIILNNKGEQSAVVKTTHVFINKASFSKTNIPEEFADKLKIHKTS